MAGDGLVMIIEQMVSADPAIQWCLFICGMVYRFAGSKTNILRIKLSQSGIKVQGVSPEGGKGDLNFGIHIDER